MKCCRLKGTDSGSIRSIPSALYQMFSQEILVQLSICAAGRYWGLEIERAQTYVGCLHTPPVGALAHALGNLLLMSTDMNFMNLISEVLSILCWDDIPAFVKLCGAAFLDFGHLEVNLKSSECCLSQWVVPWLHCSTVNIAKQVIASDAYLALFQWSCSCASLEHHTAHKPLDWAILVKTLNGIHHQHVGTR